MYRCAVVCSEWCGVAGEAQTHHPASAKVRERCREYARGSQTILWQDKLAADLHCQAMKSRNYLQSEIAFTLVEKIPTNYKIVSSSYLQWTCFSGFLLD